MRLGRDLSRPSASSERRGIPGKDLESRMIAQSRKERSVVSIQPIVQSEDRADAARRDPAVTACSRVARAFS